MGFSNDIQKLEVDPAIAKYLPNLVSETAAMPRSAPAVLWFPSIDFASTKGSSTPPIVTAVILIVCVGGSSLVGCGLQIDAVRPSSWQAIIARRWADIVASARPPIEAYPVGAGRETES